MSKQISVNLAFTADASQAKIELESLQRQLQALSTTSPVNKSEFDLTKKSIKEAATAAAQLKVQLEAATNAKTGQLDLSKFNASLKQSGMTLAEYQAKLAAMGPVGQQAFSSLTRSILQAEVSLKRSNTLISQLGTTLMNTARWQLSSSLLHAFMGAVQSAYSYSKDLNESLNNIRIVTGQNTEQMAKFAEQANRAAKELGTTTTNYTNASLIYYQQGLSDSEVKTRTDITVKMANVARTSAEKVSDQMTAVWNNFDDGSKSLEYYADVMTALGAATASSTDEISQGLNKFAAVAETVGLSYEYAASALATITSNTRESADVVGNSLKTLFARIQGLKLGETLEDGVDLNKYSEALDKVGIKVLDSNGELRRMDDLLNELAAKWGTIGKAEQTALAQTVAGVRQYTQLIALMENWDNGDNDSMVANLQTSYGSTGALAEQAKIYEESWEAARKSVKASAEDVYDSILDDKFFIKLSNGFADFLDIISNTMDALGGMKGVISGLGAVLLTAFGDKLVAGIDNFTNKLLFSTEAAKEMKIEAVKAQANNIQGSTLSDKNVSILNATDFGKASQNSAYETQYKMQLKLIESANILNSEESRVAATLLDQNQAALEQVSSNAKLLETAEQRANREKITLNYALSQSKASQKDIAHVKTLMGMYESYSKKLMGAQGVSSILGNIKKDETDLEMLRTKVTQLHQAVKAAGVTSSDLINVEPDKMELQELLKYVELVKKEKAKSNNALNEDYVAKLTQGVGNKFFDSAINMGLDRSIVDGYLNSIGAMVSANGDLIDSNNNVIATKEEYEAYLERMKAKAYSFSSALVSLASIITSVTMAINQLKGIKDIWSNEDLSTGEKIVSTLSSMAMVIPMLVNSFNAENIAKLAGLKIDRQKAITNVLTNAGLKSEIAGTNSLTAAIWKAVTAKMSFNLAATAIVATMALLTIAIIAAAKAYNKEAEEAKKAKEAAEGLAKAAEETKSKANDLRSAFDGYTSVIDKLNECTKGTQEWKDALSDVYTEVTAILAKFPELAKIDGFIKSDGTIDIDKFEQIVDQADRTAKVADYASIMGNNVYNQEQYEADTVDARRTIDDTYAYASTKDLIVPQSGGDEPISTSMQGQEKFINNIDKILMDNIDALVDDSDGTLFRDELKKLFPDPGDMPDYEGFIDSLMQYQTTLNELAAQATDNAIALENSANLIARQELGEEAKDAIVELSSEAYEANYNKLYKEAYEEGRALSRTANKANSDDLVDFWERYSKATGTNYELDQNAVTGGKDNRYFQYLDGEETKKISLEQAAAAIAAGEALTGLADSANEAKQALAQINKGEYSQGVNDFIATGSFDNTSEVQIEQMRSMSMYDEKGNLNEDNINALFGSKANLEYLAQTLAPKDKEGNLDIGEFETAIDWFLNNFTNELNSINFDSIGKNLVKSAENAFNEVRNSNSSNIKQLTANQQSDIANIFDEVYTKAGAEGLNAIKEIFNNTDLNADELLKVQEIFANTDWKTASIESLTMAFEEGEIAANGMEDPLSKIVNLMKEAAGITLDDSVKQFSLYKDILEKVQDDKGIEDSVYNELPNEMKNFFSYTAEGLWELTGNAEEFYKLAKQKAIEGFSQVESNASENNVKIQQAISEGYYDNVSESSLSNSEVWDSYSQDYFKIIDQAQVQKQIDYLSLLGKDELVAKYQSKVDEGVFSVEDANNLTNAIIELGDQTVALQQAYENNEADIEKANQAKASSANTLDELNMMTFENDDRESKEFASRNMRDQYFDSAFKKETEAEGFDVDEIEEFAESLKAANEEQIETEEEAKRLALRLSEMKRGLTTIADNWKKWNKAMEDGDPDDQAKAMGEMRDALSDLTGIDMDELPDSFFESATNAELLEKAAKGDEKAINDLIAAASKEILLKMDLDESAIPEVSSLIDEALAAIDDKNLEIGATLDDTRMYQSFQDMLNAGTVTVEQMNAILKGIGFEPEVEMKRIPIDNAVANSDGNTYTVEYLDTQGNVQKKTITSQQYNDAKSVGYIEVPVINGKNTSYTGGGGSINKSTQNKGSSGGGGGSKLKDTKKASDEIERYHEIKEVISDLERQYDNINKARTRAFGMEAIELMDQEIAKTEELIDAQKKYLSEITANREADKSALAAYGAQFDAQGRIINYDEIMSQQLEKFNASRTEEAEKAYEEFKKILEQYEETQNLLEEQEAALEELEDKIYDQKLEKVSIEVDLKISVQDDQLSVLEYMLEKLEDDAYGVAEAFALIGRQAEIFQNKSRIAQEGIDKILANHGGITLEEALAGGTQLGLTADEIESLRTYRDTLLESNQALLEMREIAIEQVTNTFDKWNEKFEKQIELLEYYSSIMESFANIVDIVGKDILGISDDMMKNLTQASVDNAINTLEGQKKRVDALRKSEEELRFKLAETTNEEERAILQEALDHIISETNAAEEDMLSTWEETLEAAADAFEEAVDLSISSFEKAISGTYGSLEGLQTAFDQASEIADRYVDDYKEIYELSKLNRDITNSIDDTDNIKAKKALRDLQREIVELQESDVQMSEYDLEHLRAKYELRLAEIALEEAQNTKSQVRMRKDSEGNYSYVFTADASAVEKAQQDYENKLYKMQELNSEYIKEMQNNILQSEIELANALRELDKVKFKSDEEYYAEVNRLTQYYTGQRNYYLDELNKSLNNNKQTVDEDWKAYSNATGYKMSADKDYMDSFDETIYAQLTGYRSIEDAQNQFADATKVMIEDLKFAFKKWQENTEAAMNAAGTSIRDFGKDVENTVYGEGENDKGIIGASEDIVTAIEGIADEMGEAFSEEAIDKFAEFAANYVDNILPMIEATDNLINKINELILKEAELDKDSNPLEKPQKPEEPTSPSIPATPPPAPGPSTTNPYGKPSELSGNYQNYTERSGVKAIQHALKEMGYNIGSYGIDGKYGSATAAAVKAFQKASGITADGIVGPDTKSKFKVKGYLTGGRVDSTGWAWLDGTPERPEYVLNADQTDAFIRLVDDLHYLNELNKLADVQKKGMLMIENTAKELMNSLEFVDDVMRVIELNAGMQSIGLGHISTNTTAMGTEPALQQEITIHAEFPDATDHNEIEAAFDSLFIRASQFANRKN